MKLIPSSYETFPNQSDGEAMIYKALRNSNSASNWTVFHSLEIAHHTKQAEGECDFVVLVPGHGAMFLEVKAARTISVSDQGWKLGKNKVSKKGPFNQAKEAMYSIKEYLEKEHGLDLRDTPMVYAVWFTHLPKKSIPKGVSWNDDQFFAQEDTKKEITALLRERIDLLAEKIPAQFPTQRAPVKSLEAISEALRPRFTATQAPAQRKRDIQAFLDVALTDQLERVDLALSLPRVAIQGLAGTGKTLIALHAARLAQDAASSTLFVCYTRLLAERLKEELIQCPQVKVSSLHALMLQIAGAEAPKNADSVWWSQTLPELAMKNVAEARERFGFKKIIIDEAQDIGMEEYLFFLDELLPGGLIGSEVLVCGDFENQGLFTEGLGALEAYKSAIPDLAIPKPLLTNCRNTREVGEFVQTWLNLKPAYENYRNDDADGAVDFSLLNNDAEIPSRLTQTLKRMLQRYEADQIVVISSTPGKLSSVMSGLKLESTSLREPSKGKVRFGGIGEFKGLEAMGIVHVEFESDEPPSLGMVYVGATRSVNDYALIFSAKTKKLMEGAAPQ